MHVYFSGKQALVSMATSTASLSTVPGIEAVETCADCSGLACSPTGRRWHRQWLELPGRVLCNIQAAIRGVDWRRGRRRYRRGCASAASAGLPPRNRNTGAAEAVAAASRTLAASFTQALPAEGVRASGSRLCLPCLKPCLKKVLMPRRQRRPEALGPSSSFSGSQARGSSKHRCCKDTALLRYIFFNNRSESLRHHSSHFGSASTGSWPLQCIWDVGLFSDTSTFSSGTCQGLDSRLLAVARM